MRWLPGVVRPLATGGEPRWGSLVIGKMCVCRSVVASHSFLAKSLTVTWTGDLGHSYEVQCSTDLKNWQTVSPPINGVQDTQSWQVPLPESGSCFIRIKRD